MLTNKDKELLKMLLRSNESSLLKALENYLNLKYNKCNVFAKKDFIYATGDIPILLVAHVDTVLHKAPKIFTNKEGNIWMGQNGLGADDRAGVFALLKIIQSGRKPSILFTSGEEIGGLGAIAFVKDFPEPPVPTKYIIEIDRRGRGQAVFYDCGNTKFMSYVESFGFKIQNGIFSDISFICPQWDTAGVNLSAGYYNEHTYLESLKIEDLFYTIKQVNHMLDVANETEIFSYEEKTKNKTNLYTQCQICGNFIPLFSTSKVENINICIECMSNFVEWCDNCGKPFFIKTAEAIINEENLCEECANVLQ